MSSCSRPRLKMVHESLARESRVHAVQSFHSRNVGKEFATYVTVNHGEREYARGDVTTNTGEGFYGIFKRSMIGTYQHCSVEGGLHGSDR